MKVTCPYCGANTFLTDSAQVDKGHRSVPIYLCNQFPVCDAYVKCDKDGKPKGTFANGHLRRLREEAYLLFSQVWDKRWYKRKEIYALLSTEINLPLEQTQIRLLDRKQCLQCIDLLHRLKNEK